nr:ribonuclease H-like domain, reverse transcriptase, RNA-dependent DNA polymerase [Tanacetum cinerariifolium]
MDNGEGNKEIIWSKTLVMASQWKFLIHTIIQSLSAKRTSWNEFSTTMASAVICLSKGQKFNFLKYIFDSLVRNVDSSSKFYMYPRFIQLIIQNQVGDLSTHTTRLISPALTQKVDDAVAAVVEENVAEDVAHDTIPSPPPYDIPSPSQEPSSPPQQQQKNDNAAQKLVIVKLKAKVQKLEKANKIKSSKLRHLRKVKASRRVESFDDMKDVFNQGRMIDDMDMNEGIELIKDAEVAESKGRNAAEHAEIYNLDLDHSSKVLSMQKDDSKVQEVVEVVTTAKLITEVVTAAVSQVSAAASATIPAASATIPAAKPTIPAAAPTVVAVYTRRRKRVIIRDPEEELSLKTPAETPKVKDKGIKKRPQTESEARKNMMIYLRNTAGYKMDFFKKAAKRRKLSEEAQEAEDLRKRLEVVEDEDDDVFVEATPLASKVPVVDYHIVLIDNKPRIVKDRFSTSKPTNFSDEYLLLTLKTMFEEPDGQDAIWRNQKSVHGLALVKRWKLLTLCSVHVITLSIVQLFLWVERRFTRQQLQEYQQG